MVFIVAQHLFETILWLRQNMKKVEIKQKFLSKKGNNSQNQAIYLFEIE